MAFGRRSAQTAIAGQTGHVIRHPGDVGLQRSQTLELPAFVPSFFQHLTARARFGALASFEQPRRYFEGPRFNGRTELPHQDQITGCIHGEDSDVVGAIQRIVERWIAPHTFPDDVEPRRRERDLTSHA